MAGDLERALSKLRTDNQVLGYSLMTKVGRPFISFSFPGDIFPRVKDSIKLYKSDLRLMTIDTEKGLVVLSPVDANWILTVLYIHELQLGVAIAKTKNVLRLLEGIELPPPPEDFEDSAEANLQVLQSIAIKAASTAPGASEAVMTSPQAKSLPSVAPAPKAAIEKQSPSPDDFYVLPTTIPKKGETHSNALSLDSVLCSEMKKVYRNFGFDVLMLVDGSRTVTQIAESMFQPNERVASFLKWAASKGIVALPEAKERTPEEKASPSMGRFVKCPLFEGDLSKVKSEDVPILKLCDGSRTPEKIAEETGSPQVRVIQVLALYRRLGLKMIGKAV
ncbi:MAG: hypothetical protein C4K47_10370 [Candidatus Thorarchaeota archaeon]|nr:MAG: hypothetical protein C4K47_10370 [Candidatus Thorarchaeota archaeon]